MLKSPTNRLSLPSDFSNDGNWNCLLFVRYFAMPWQTNIIASVMMKLGSRDVTVSTPDSQPTSKAMKNGTTNTMSSERLLI